jgi:hypothetical protein
MEVNIKRKKTNEIFQLNIEKLNLENFVQHPSIVMIGKRGSGKSYMVADIVKKIYTDKTKLTIFSPTDKMCVFYGNHFLNADINYELNREKIADILEEQKDNIQNKNGINQIVVLDDCLSSKGEWKKDPFLVELLFNGRHYHITYILTMQFPLDILPELRNNFDYIFLLEDDTFSNQNRIYKQYAGIFPNFEEFQQIYIQLTANYGSMVIVNKVSSSNFLEKVRYYKVVNVLKNTNSNSNSNSNSNNCVVCNSDSDSDTTISDNSSEDYFQQQFGYYLANPEKIRYKIHKKQKILLLKEFSFKNTEKNHVYFVVGKNKKDRNMTIKKILDNYFSKGLSKDITHIKNETEYDVIKKIIIEQDNEEKQNNHIVVFDDCLINFDSFSNRKKCALYELFLRHKELNLTIIIQTSDLCYEQLKEKQIPDFINNTINYTLLLPEKSRNNKVLLYNLFGKTFSSYQYFNDIFTQITNVKLSANIMIIEKENDNFSYLALNYDKDTKLLNDSFENLVDFE